MFASMIKSPENNRNSNSSLISKQINLSEIPSTPINLTKTEKEKEVEYMSLPMYNDEERRKMNYYNYVKCGHKLSDITKKKLKEMAKARKDREEALKEQNREKIKDPVAA